MKGFAPVRAPLSGEPASHRQIREDSGVPLDEAARQSVDVLRSVGDELDLGRYSVIRSYCRFSFEARTLMGVWWEAIHAALATSSRQRQNFLLWGKPGEGKT